MKSKTQVYKTRKFIRNIRKQAGMTLMEIIAALAIIAAVVVGALALFNSAQSSNQSVTMLKDIIAIRAAVQQMFTGQGGYGLAVPLNQTLINARKVPSDMQIVGAGPVINTPLQGTLAVASNAAGTAFTITLTSVPNDVCTQLLTNASSGWSNAPMPTVNGAPIAPATYPISPVVAGAACALTAGNDILVWTSAQ